MHQVCLLLGSNIEPEKNIPLAVDLLKTRLSVLQVSSVWQSVSVDCCYPDYLNLAALVSTPLEAEELKDQVLHPLEAHMGRVRTEDKNASRTIDIDLILFDGDLLDSTLWEHVHMAMPVAEIFPEYRSPDGEALADAARRLAQGTPIVHRLDVAIPFP